MAELPVYTEMFCPVTCRDRKFVSLKSKEHCLSLVKKHVELQHPDYDPEWWREEQILGGP